MNLGETGQHLFGHFFTFDSSDSSPEKLLYCKGLGLYFLGRTGISGPGPLDRPMTFLKGGHQWTKKAPGLVLRDHRPGRFERVDRPWTVR